MAPISALFATALTFFAAQGSSTDFGTSSMPPLTHHRVSVQLDIPHQQILVEDTLFLVSDRPATVELPAGVTPEITGADVDGPVEDDGVARFVVTPRGKGPVVLRYKARFTQAPQQAAQEHARSFQETAGIIEPRGVYLSPSSRWLPIILDDTGAPRLIIADVTITGLPARWMALTEGTPEETDKGPTVLHQVTPVEGLHLIAGPFTEAKKTLQGTDVVIWLRRGEDGGAADDADALAQRYHEVTGQYLKLFGDLIGPYPYDRFTLVENFWETGYGMPSFTLLGPQVVRFPFILHTSWPHELLHNWWGNGVFPGDDGNWTEGLTAYLADHEDAERNDRGHLYRRDTIQRYLDFVRTNPDDDFPLTAFTNRFSAASEAIGYGKTALVFHMWRVIVGDQAFADGLKRLWQKHQFERASFVDVAAALSTPSHDARPFFAAWTTQKGIPTVRLVEVREEVRPPQTHGHRRFATVVLEQSQPGPTFPMTVPVLLTTADGKTLATQVVFKGRRGESRVPITGPLARVDVDPFFDVFRTLSPDEVPPSLSRALGAHKHLFVTPTFGSKDERAQWQAFAEGLCPEQPAKTSKRCTIVDDKTVGTLPADAAVWVLGAGNTLRAGAFVGAKDYDARFDDRGFFGPGGWRRVMDQPDSKSRREAYDKERSDPGTTAMAVVVEHPRNRALAMAFVESPKAAMIPALLRKLPHYGKYGVVGFAGDDVENTLKLQWPALSSPMTKLLREDPGFRLPPPPALAPLPPPFDGVAMQTTVAALADGKTFPKGRGQNAEAQVMDFLEKRVADLGLKGERHCLGSPAGEVCNLVVHLEGTRPTLPPVLLSAHFDHLDANGRTRYPGADDNASGVAVLLELLPMLARQQQARSLEVVFFGGEERGLLGSRIWAGRAKARGGLPMAVVNLDSVGRAGADGFLVLDGQSAKEWVHIVRGVGFTTGVKATLAPQGGGASDQKAYLDLGVPGIQLFSGPHPDYHRPTDTADKLSERSLVDAAVFAREVVVYLRDRTDPLTAVGANETTTSTTASTPTTRRASLGSVPDMAFAGPGVRFSDVVADSPAATAGLRAGDVLVRFAGQPVADLRGYSELLKQHSPGDVVEVVVRRDGVEVRVSVTLGTR